MKKSYSQEPKVNSDSVDNGGLHLVMNVHRTVSVSLNEIFAYIWLQYLEHNASTSVFIQSLLNTGNYFKNKQVKADGLSVSCHAHKTECEKTVSPCKRQVAK